ncbi:hypothetical protein ACQ7FX_00120 [Arthrobacter koreensis]|uniref:hypothetical protein n=1 Tax=Arthrobacter koreensis TaxID=199136 RepID=UPI003D94CF7F
MRTPLAISQTLLEVARNDPDRDVGHLSDRLHHVNVRAIDLTEALLLLSRTDQKSFTSEGGCHCSGRRRRDHAAPRGETRSESPDVDRVLSYPPTSSSRARSCGRTTRLRAGQKSEHARTQIYLPVD